MEYELKDIKEIRKKFGLTQVDLSKKARVSQSLIAKVEAGRLDPTFTNAKKIFSALDDLTKKQEAKAEDVMVKKILSVEVKTDIRDVIKKMRKHGYSQMPVIDNDKVVGVISEAVILDALLKGDKYADAGEIMQECPPSIDKNASLTVVSGLLRHYQMVLVMEKGKLLGVITKSDVIEKLSEKGKMHLFG